MSNKKPLFSPPYDLKDVGLLFAVVALFLIIAALIGNNLFGLFQENINFGWNNIVHLRTHNFYFNKFLIFNILLNT